MQKTIFNHCAATLRFTHFSHKGYSLFACMGRSVVIGTLSVATLQHAKAEGISAMPEFANDTLQRKELKLDEVVVTGSRAPLTQSETARIVSVITRDEVQRAAVETVNDVLKLATGVDVRQRGSYGVQTDISVRGGNFDQITILLNGVNISSPHTGHLSADFPISPDDIEEIEVLEGGYETGLCGVINIKTVGHGVRAVEGKEPLKAYAHLSGGSYGYFNGNAGVNYASRHFAHSVSGGYTRSDGATANSAFTSSRVFYDGTYKTENLSVSAQLGYSYKPYEANTFYGASSTDQWESNERLMGAINAEVKVGALHILPQFYWNRWYDHYQWHRDKPAGENYHMVDARGTSLSAWFTSSLGRTSFGGEARDEGIWSTKLGKLQEEALWKKSRGHDASDDIVYKYHDSRTVWKFYLEHNILLKHFTISPSLSYIKIGETDRWCPALNMSWRPNSSWEVFASYNMALRMPTFTDLYYSGANIEGNSNLRPEKTNDFQLGLRRMARGYRAEAQLFYSHKTDMIDWVQYAEAGDNVFHSVNFQMDSWGAELNFSLLPQELFSSKFPVRKLEVRYAYIYQDPSYSVTMLQSKYAMEYLRNKLILSADTRLWRNLNMNLSWRLNDRIGENNPSYALMDAKLSWDAPRYTLYVDGTNIFNRHYFDYQAIPQPGFVVTAGVKVRF